MENGGRLPIHWRILIGLVLGLGTGLLVNVAGPSIDRAVGTDGIDRALVDFVVQANAFVGALFLRCLRFVAVPVVLFSLIAGTASLDDLRKLGRIGGKTVAIYLSTTALAISVGLLLSSVLRPGRFVPAELRDRLAAKGDVLGERLEAAAPPDFWQRMLDLVPTNPFEAIARGDMLQVVVFALAIGIGLTLLPRERSRPVAQACETLSEVVLRLVHVVMVLAPYAVFALLAKVVAELGFDVLGALFVYSLTVLLGLGVMIGVVYPTLLRVLTGSFSARRFFTAIAPAQLLAFSSSSSAATLPVTLDCVENRLGVSKEVTSFAIPLGATINMDGTALYQGVATAFIMQLYGLDLSLSQLLTIVLTATLASIGTAGVPGVGIVMLVIVLQSIGLAPEMMQKGIAIIFGVDRLLDMARTVCNVTGDCAVAVVVGRSEGASPTTSAG